MAYLEFFIIVAVIIGIAAARKASGGGGAKLRGFGITVANGNVKSGARVLGPLAGAHAEVTDGTSRHTLTRVVTVAGAFTRKTSAAVTISFPSGAAHVRKIQGASEIRRAQTWAIRFNAMSAAQAGQGE